VARRSGGELSGARFFGNLAVFAIVAVLHFVICVAGLVFALPAAFDGFAVSPGKTVLAWIAGILLAPLPWLGRDYGYAEIGVLSAFYGFAAVSLVRLVATRRAARRTRA
jgi:hypothetical protein